MIHRHRSSNGSPLSFLDVENRVLPDHRFAPLMLLVDRAALLVFAGLPTLSLHRNQLTGEILAELSHLPEGPVEELALDFAHFANGASTHLRPGVGE